jgi:hypothetical protein
MCALGHVLPKIIFIAVKRFGESDRGVVAGIDDHALNEILDLHPAVDGSEHSRAAGRRAAVPPGIGANEQLLIERQCFLFQRLKDKLHRHELGEARRRIRLVGAAFEEIAAVLVIYQHGVLRGDVGRRDRVRLLRLRERAFRREYKRRDGR